VDLLDDREKFFAAVWSSRRKIFNCCFRIVAKKPCAHSLAEELTQETMLRAWQRQDTFRSDARLDTWLYAIARNITIDYLRRVKKQPITTPLEEIIVDAPDGSKNLLTIKSMIENHTEKRYEDRQLLEKMYAAIDKLPYRFREVALLRMEDWEYEEIADFLNIPEGTVKSRIFRLPELIKQQLNL
jgi:RNA polymerase sigma-70 factor (ECF subfamily)